MTTPRQREDAPFEPLFSTATWRTIQDTPWKAANEMERLMLLPVARIMFMAVGIRWREGWKLYGLPIIQKHTQSTITIGARLELRSTARSNPLGAHRAMILSTRKPDAVLTIGDDFSMTGGSIVVDRHITIGSRVLVGANSTITDTDFHPLDPQTRRERLLDGATAPVNIGDDVFIGMQCLILKGVTIGAGSAIGAGSVVTDDVPPGVLVVGNPAQVVREL